MRNVYCIGENVYDIIFKNGQPVAAKAGGSLLNSSVSLGRLGVPVSFISELGSDQVGDLIEQFLRENNVSTAYMKRYKNAKSAIALAFLDEHNEATYSFYKFKLERRLDTQFPKLRKDDIVLFGSFFAVDPQVRERLLVFLNHAHEQGAIIVYDPNFRKPHHRDLAELNELVIQNMQLADIVRGSNEDFENLFGTSNEKQVYKIVSPYCNNLIYTANVYGVELLTPQFSKHYEISQIKPVSTIGAGDSFDAGIVYGLLHCEIRKEQVTQISTDSWDHIIRFGISFAQNVCCTYDNYIDEKISNELKFI